MSYDPACETVAEVFLNDEAADYTKEELSSLSQAIQNTIEDWLADRDAKSVGPLDEPAGELDDAAAAIAKAEGRED